MPYEIEYGIPVGYSPVDVAPGEYFWAIITEFVSSEDGELFMRRLDGIPSAVIDMLQAKKTLTYSMIDHMLVIFHPDGKATVYINELCLNLLVLPSKEIATGRPICINDISYIARLRFGDGLSIPDDCGLLFLFSVGWRKGLYYDFSPLNGTTRDYDLDQLLGGYFSYLSFQQLFNITDSEWESLFKLGWFPFSGLQEDTINQILFCARTNGRADLLTEVVAKSFDARIEELLLFWSCNQLLVPHQKFLKEAVKHYIKNEFVAACSIIYPRIEGLIRTFHHSQSLMTNPRKQENLAKAVISQHQERSHKFSRLMPEKFRSYLETVFFKGFDPNDVIEDLNRNTVGHGIAPYEEYNKKGAIIGFLTIEQILFFACSEPTHTSDSSNSHDQSPA